MLRTILIAGLLISLFFLVRAIAVTWQEEAVPTVPSADKAPLPATSENPGIVFYPPVPAELPDLNLGYIFNETRMLVVEPREDKKEREPMVAITDIFYIGSVISSERRIGIVGYPEQNATSMPQQSPGRSRPGGEAAAAVDKHVQLAPGETFSGYLVVDVLPEKIVFEKDGIKVEKSILKANKDRRQPLPQLQVDRRPQGRPPASSTVRPGQNRATIRMSDPKDLNAARPSNRESISARRMDRNTTRI